MPLDFVSSTTLIAVAIGVSAYLCVLHFWFARARLEANLWVAIWALLTLLFQSGRVVQLHAPTPAIAVTVSHFYTSLAPLLIATLVGFVRSMAGRPNTSLRYLGFLAANVALCSVMLSTSWFTSDQVYVRADLFGKTYWGVVGTPAMSLLSVYILIALTWVVTRMRGSLGLEPGERRFLIGSLAVYAAMGLSSTLSSMRLISFPGLAEYGPVVMAVGLSYLLVHRRRRLEDDLQQLVAQRTAELVVSESRYRGLVEAAPIGIVACDRRGVITMANKKRVEQSGAPSSEAMLGMNLLEHEAMVRAGVASLLREAMDEDRVVRAERRYEGVWGKTQNLRGVMAPLHDAEGSVNGAVILLEDRTEQDALEQRLRQAQKMESIGQLAAGIAHEINNPMAYVRSNLNQLRAEWQRLAKAVATFAAGGEPRPPLGECEALIDESLVGVNRTIAIVRDLREFALAGSEQRVPVELRSVIDAALRSASPQRRGEARLLDATGEPPPVLASARQLQQVFSNLVVNALQAVGERGTVGLECESTNSHVLIRVRDDGPGIPPGVRERLFEPFFTTKPPGVGTGLGLYICWEIVKAHGGELSFDPSERSGACFEVRLPRHLGGSA